MQFSGCRIRTDSKKKKKTGSILFHVYEWFAYVCVCAPPVCPVPAEVEEGVSSPEVEFRVVVSHHVVLVTKHQFSAGTASVSLDPN